MCDSLLNSLPLVMCLPNSLPMVTYFVSQARDCWFQSILDAIPKDDRKYLIPDRLPLFQLVIWFYAVRSVSRCVLWLDSCSL